MSEMWKTIPGLEEYAASTFGRIRRQAPDIGGQGAVRISGECLAQRSLPTGHRMVTVSVRNVPATYLVHRLVALAFLATPPAEKDCVCHRDDDPSNNTPDNLFWGSRRDNSDDKVSKGRHVKGEQVTSRKLTEAQVLAIRDRVASGANQYELAAEYGVKQSNISMIVGRKTWKHLP